MSYKVGDKVILKCEVCEINNNHVLNVGIMTDDDTLIYVQDKYLQKDEKTYSDGLADAWELARKIVLKAEMGGICFDDFKKIFGVGDYVTVLRTLSPQQALAKIEAYEKSQQIQIGDVVYCPVVDNKEGICVGRGNDGQEYALVWFKEYDCPQNMLLKDLKKTGRHIDISHLLEQIRGNE